MSEYGVQRMGRSYKGSSQTIAYIKDLAYQNLCFCDASITLDGFIPVEGSIAIWSLVDLSFVVQLVSFSEHERRCLGKQDAVNLLEIMAVQLASATFPSCEIKTDSQIAVITCQKFGISADWIPRELNAIANKLAKNKKPGRGYIAFNSHEPERNWIDFIFE